MTMKYLFLAAVLTIGLALQSACDKDNPVSQGGGATILMPLKVGNQWTYLLKAYDTSGTAMVTDTITFALLRDTTIQNEKWYFIVAGASAVELLANRPDGLWYRRIGPDGQSPVLFAKYPASVNDTWIGIDSSTARVVSTNAGISVPKGTYTCFHYTYADKYYQFVTSARFFAVGIGFVRDEYYNLTNSGRTYVAMRRELTNLALTKSGSTLPKSSRQDFFLPQRSAGKF